MREIIQASRMRSAGFGIKKDQVISRKMLSSDALMTKILSNRALILVAEPIMNQLYDFVRGSNFIAILTDAEGCILSMIGDEAILLEAHTLQMVPGAYMDEASIGTNAMGTAIFTGEPLQVSGEEHIIEAYYRWTCSCGLIRDENQRVIGALDLTGYKEGAHSHTLGMVVAAIRAVENTLKLQGKNKTIDEQSHLASRVMEMVDAALLICGVDGKIQHINAQAVKLLGIRGEQITDKPLWHFVKDYEKLAMAFKEQGMLVDRQVYLSSDCTTDSLSLTATPIDVGEAQDKVFLLRLNQGRISRKLKQSIADSQAIYTFDKIIGLSSRMSEIIAFAKQISDSRSTVLITGESGTGKEVFAHAIHNHSERRQRPFVVVNCAAIPNSLIESELFGYEEGAFTGAKKGGNPGKFEVADGGTLFLDEIGDMPYAMQTRLLRVLQEGVICRVGSHHPRAVDVRLIAATNRDLSEAVAKGRFRLDLFYRLNVLPLHLPALRERPEDILPLADYFLGRLARKNNRKPFSLSSTEMAQLQDYDWPGNIRELENVMEWRLNTDLLPAYLTLTGNPKYNDLSEGGINILGRGSDATPSKADDQSEFESLETFETRYINQVYTALNGNLAKTAKILGVARNTVYKKLNK